jgi:hypothetical protein
MKDSIFKRNFQESSFWDRTTNTGTFYYRTKNDTGSLTRVDVVTMKGDVYDEVKSIYIEKNTMQGKQPVVKKMMWKPKRNFQIISIKTNDKDQPENEIIKVVWDNRE